MTAAGWRRNLLPGATLTILAMLAFAGNSLLCRLALRDGLLDPASFTAIRLLSGAVMLALLVVARHRDKQVLLRAGNWISSLALFAYALCFSLAYISLDAGTGALILFGFVQATMIGFALKAGDRPGVLEWAGWLLAAAGLTALLIPGAEAPSHGGAALMAVAGIAWGVYTLRGRQAGNPLHATAGNFFRAAILGIVVMGLAFSSQHFSWRGILLAMVSGAVTSGIGYVLWYAAISYLTSMQAALVQLSVPALAAAGGVWLLAEPLTARLVVSGAMTLAGISLALLHRNQGRENVPPANKTG